jgi:TonB family protein
MFNRSIKVKSDLLSLVNKWTSDGNPLKKFIASSLKNLVMETRYRLTSSLSLSLLIHFVALMAYLGLGVLDQPAEPPIREIKFVDMTEVEKPPEEVLKKKRPAPVVQPFMAENLPPEPEQQPAPVPQTASNAPIALGKDRIFLDAPREQAPINMNQYEPVSGVNDDKNVLAVSPAIGIKNDDKTSKPAPIELGSNRDLMTGSGSQSQGAVSFGHGGKPQIDLQAGRSTGPVVSAPQDFAPSTPAPKKEEPLEKPKETQTIITGALASREIVKKVIPPFPPWAKRQGVGATIALRFTVMENGTVKENVIIERTSGSLQWDQMVIAALKNWKFAPLSASGIRQDQTGVITFQFVI